MWWNKKPKNIYIHVSMNEEKLDNILKTVKELQQDNIDLKKIVQASKDLDESTNKLKEAVDKNMPKT